MTNGITLYYCISGEQTINKNQIENMTAEIGIREKKAHCGTKQMHGAHNIVSNLNLIGQELGAFVDLI